MDVDPEAAQLLQHQTRGLPCFHFHRVDWRRQSVGRRSDGRSDSDRGQQKSVSHQCSHYCLGVSTYVYMLLSACPTTARCLLRLSGSSSPLSPNFPSWLVQSRKSCLVWSGERLESLWLDCLGRSGPAGLGQGKCRSGWTAYVLHASYPRFHTFPAAYVSL